MLQWQGSAGTTLVLLAASETHESEKEHVKSSPVVAEDVPVPTIVNVVYWGGANCTVLSCIM